MINFGLLLGGLLSAVGLGWIVGRWIKTIRQFFDSI